MYIIKSSTNKEEERMKSSTAQMNDRKRNAGLRQISQWVIDVRGTDLEEAFNKELKELRQRIEGLSANYEVMLITLKRGRL
jgi:hypothetical protein